MQDCHVQLKAKCRACSLHFIVCTWHPDLHTAATLHCPECGQHAGAFLTWSEAVAAPICTVVPGHAPLTADWLPDGGTKHIDLADLTSGDPPAED